MSAHNGRFFGALSSDSVVSALVHDDVITIAKDEDSVSLPVEIAVEIASETIRLLLDEDGLRNQRGETLSEYLGDADDTELRRILARVAGPATPTYTTCGGSH